MGSEGHPQSLENRKLKGWEALVGTCVSQMQAPTWPLEQVLGTERGDPALSPHHFTGPQPSPHPGSQACSEAPWGQRVGPGGGTGAGASSQMPPGPEPLHWAPLEQTKEWRIPVCLGAGLASKTPTLLSSLSADTQLPCFLTSHLGCDAKARGPTAEPYMQAHGYQHSRIS